jgi:hypothetical protein
MFYLADLIDGQFAAGTESLEVALFAPEDIPWNDIAFKTVTKTLRHYLSLSNPNEPTQLTGVVTYAPKVST